jgi:hypothetical protein
VNEIMKGAHESHEGEVEETEGTTNATSSE